MTASKTIDRKPETYEYERVSFDIRDQKGRLIGYQMTICEGLVRETGYGYVALDAYMDGQTVFAASFFPTRDGVSYGASHGTKYFSTRTEAEDAFRKAAEASRTRYTKQYGTR